MVRAMERNVCTSFETVIALFHPHVINNTHPLNIICSSRGSSGVSSIFFHTGLLSSLGSIYISACLNYFCFLFYILYLQDLYNSAEI